MDNNIQRMDLAQQILVSLYDDTRSSEIADAMDMLSAWREQYIKDNSAQGVGA